MAQPLLRKFSIEGFKTTLALSVEVRRREGAVSKPFLPKGLRHDRKHDPMILSDRWLTKAAYELYDLQSL
jgi:hypothetical protein